MYIKQQKSMVCPHLDSQETTCVYVCVCVCVCVCAFIGLTDNRFESKPSKQDVCLL